VKNVKKNFLLIYLELSEVFNGQWNVFSVVLK